jgi:hypothetical protein
MLDDYTFDVSFKDIPEHSEREILQSIFTERANNTNSWAISNMINARPFESIRGLFHSEPPSIYESRYVDYESIWPVNHKDMGILAGDFVALKPPTEGI